MIARVAVLASGGGTNLQALIDYFHRQEAPAARVELVVANRPGIGALARAETARIESVVQGDADDLLGLLREHRIDLIVLAGYLRLVPPQVVSDYRRRIVNIHPALLPAFGGRGMFGLHVHRAVLQAGVRVSGATVHLVDEEYDRGSILAQWPVPVLADDTAESLAARVLAVEHQLLPLSLERLVRSHPTLPLADPVSFELVSRAAPLPASVQAVLPSGGSPPGGLPKP
jgi:phosphoribosylglycinamide formyltransferase 1